MSEDQAERPEQSRRPARRSSPVRPGEGRIVSVQEAKGNMNRSFVRAEHQGPTARKTEWEAGNRLGKGVGPTQTEMDMVFEDNPRDVKIFRGQGMNDRQIYDALKNRH